MTSSLGEHFFRHEYGRLVAILSRRVGVHRLEAIEDAVQLALLAAVESWPRASVPDNPSAWLYRVAHNHFVGELRRRARRDELDELSGHRAPDGVDVEPAILFSGEVGDDLLRMLFVCCDDAIPVPSQLALALKTLCGFDVAEIAERLFTTEANVYKRLGRARSRLRESTRLPDDLSGEQLTSRLPAVQTIVYVLFTEGYLSSHAEEAIRRELCDEALRLTEVLAGHRTSAVPETFALLSLMYLHRARMSARQDRSAGLLLLEEQDRCTWNARDIERGLSWLARSAEGEAFSRYHAEAGIAAEHCLAPSFAETRWDRIVDCYALLERLAPSPIHTLNRAVALAEWQGVDAALALLDEVAPPAWLATSYCWDAVLADLYRRVERFDAYERHRDRALARAPSDAVRALLQRRLETAIGPVVAGPAS
jgi:RNA polymerase sigma-70 factor (ECF subfamily)